MYALHQQQVSGAANRIYGFRLNPDTGALTALPGFPVDSGGNGPGSFDSERIRYLNGRLYVINEGSNTLTAFKVNRTTGALAPLAFSPIALLNLYGTWGCVTVHPSGSPVVVGGAHGFVSVNVSATTATASHFATGSVAPVSCEFSRNGNYLYGGGGDLGSRFVGFSVDAGTGVLTPLAGSPFESGSTFPIAFATDSSGRLFLAHRTQHVRAFTTAAGVPTGVSGNPFASGIFGAADGVVHPSGYYMVADVNGDRVAVSRIGGDGAATTLTAVGGSPFPSGGSRTNALALTEDGTFLVAVNDTSRNLTVFQVNPATGGLTPLVTQAPNTLGATGNVPGVTFVAVTPPFLDDPLTATTSVVKAAHITELRTRIDAVRAQYGLGPYSYSDPTLSVATTPVRAAHVTDLRAALGEVYTALGMGAPGYTDPTLSAGVTVVKLSHIMELRAAVLSIE